MFDKYDPGTLVDQKATRPGETRKPTRQSRYNRDEMESLSPTTTKIKSGSSPLISEQVLAAMRDAGVVEAFLFGSVARGDYTDASDIDILVRFDEGVSFWAPIDLSLSLTQLTGRPVDVLTQIHPAFSKFIEPTLVPIEL